MSGKPSSEQHVEDLLTNASIAFIQTGWPDFLVFNDDGVACIEAKQPNEKLRDTQVICHTKLRYAGVQVHVVRTGDHLPARLFDIPSQIRGRYASHSGKRKQLRASIVAATDHLAHMSRKCRAAEHRAREREVLRIQRDRLLEQNKYLKDQLEVTTKLVDDVARYLASASGDVLVSKRDYDTLRYWADKGGMRRP